MALQHGEEHQTLQALLDIAPQSPTGLPAPATRPQASRAKASR
jgi:hypothetical protein